MGAQGGSPFRPATRAALSNNCEIITEPWTGYIVDFTRNYWTGWAWHWNGTNWIQRKVVYYPATLGPYPTRSNSGLPYWNTPQPGIPPAEYCLTDRRLKYFSGNFDILCGPRINAEGDITLGGDANIAVRHACWGCADLGDLVVHLHDIAGGDDPGDAAVYWPGFHRLTYLPDATPEPCFWFSAITGLWMTLYRSEGGTIRLELTSFGTFFGFNARYELLSFTIPCDCETPITLTLQVSPTGGYAPLTLDLHWARCGTTVLSIDASGGVVLDGDGAIRNPHKQIIDTDGEISINGDANLTVRNISIFSIDATGGISIDGDGNVSATLIVPIDIGGDGGIWLGGIWDL